MQPDSHILLNNELNCTSQDLLRFLKNYLFTRQNSFGLHADRNLREAQCFIHGWQTPSPKGYSGWCFWRSNPNSSLQLAQGRPGWGYEHPGLFLTCSQVDWSNFPEVLPSEESVRRHCYPWRRIMPVVILSGGSSGRCWSFPKTVSWFGLRSFFSQ